MRVLLAFVLVACSSARGPAGPSWPKAAEREADGGESLAPRAAARAIAAIVEDDRAADRAEKPGATPAAASVGSADKPATATPNTQQPEEFPGEDIIIEIEE